MNGTCSTLLLLQLALSGPPADPPAAVPRRLAKVATCRVSLIEQARVPALVSGMLLEIGAREGETVSAGAVLAQIDDRQEAARRTILQLEDELAAERAIGQTELQHAAASARLAEAQYSDALATNKKVSGAISSVAIQRLELKREEARLGVQRLADAQATGQLASRIAKARLAAAELALARHRLVSPITGVIVRRFRDPGEWVDAGDAVLHVVRIDRLRVEGLLNSQEFPPHHVRNRPAKVRIRLSAGETREFVSHVTYVSPVVEAGGQYRVCAEIQNLEVTGHWLLRPGMSAEMTVQLDAAPVVDRLP